MFRALSLLVTLVLMVVLGVAIRPHLGSGGGGNETSGTPELLLKEAGMIVERTHQVTGSYSGISLQDDQGMRLVSATPTAYCLQLAWINQQPYHLSGPGGTPARGPC